MLTDLLLAVLKKIEVRQEGVSLSHGLSALISSLSARVQLNGLVSDCWQGLIGSKECQLTYVDI
jgi:hypothetical protein